VTAIEVFSDKQIQFVEKPREMIKAIRHYPSNGFKNVMGGTPPAAGWQP